MFKNISSQSVTLSAVDASTGLPKAGDSANMVFYVSKDDGTVTAIAASSGVPTESDATNAKGDYKIALSQAETNANKLRFSGKSSTTNVVVISQTVYTTPPNFTATSIDSSGVVQSNLVQILATALTESVAGYLSGAFKQFFNITSPTSTMNAITLVATATTATNLTNAPTSGDFTTAMKTSLNSAVPTIAATQSFNNTGQTTNVPANTKQFLNQAVVLDANSLPSVNVADLLGTAVGSTLIQGVVVVGSSGSSVIVSGLPTTKTYAGQFLYHYASGEKRIIAGQSFASGNYTFTFGGVTGTVNGPFDSVTTGDLVSPT